MTTIKQISVSLVALSLGLGSSASEVLAISDPLVVYFVDPQDQDPDKAALEPILLADDEIVIDLNPIPNAPDPEVIKKGAEAQKKLDELIEKIQRGSRELSEKHKRIAAIVKKEQVEFLALLEEFVTTPFNSRDDDAEPEFSRIRDRLVILVFDAPTKRDYYERIYLINQKYLENPEMEARFESLHRHLLNRQLDMEARQKQIRLLIAGGAGLVGFGLGGYISYKMSFKVMPVVATEGGISSIAKMAGRGGMIILGAGFGAGALGYIGFLGSDLLFKNERQFIDPIQKNEDLKDILDYVDGLNTKGLPL